MAVWATNLVEVCSLDDWHKVCYGTPLQAAMATEGGYWPESANVGGDGEAAASSPAAAEWMPWSAHAR